MKNKTIRIKNIEIYGKICMAGYVLCKENPLTLHHITPKSEGGRTTLENSSNISNLAHSAVHILHADDLRKARYIREYLLYFRYHPDINLSYEFAQWLHSHMQEYGYESFLTKDKLLTYKRRV